jgi:hypothetical protein
VEAGRNEHAIEEITIHGMFLFQFNAFNDFEWSVLEVLEILGC